MRGEIMTYNLKLIFTFLTLLSFGLSSQTHAQVTPPATEVEDVDEEAAATAQRVADAARFASEAALITSENMLRDARLNQLFGDTEITGQRGLITADAVTQTQFAQLLVYDSLNKATDEIFKTVCPLTQNNEYIFLGNIEDYIASRNTRRLVDLQIRNIEDDTVRLSTFVDALPEFISAYEEIIKKREEDAEGSEDGNDDKNIRGLFAAQSLTTIGTVLDAIPRIAGRAEEISNIFRTDVTLTAVPVTLSNSVLRSSLVESRINYSKICGKLIDPAVVVDNRTLDELTSSDGLIKDLNNARDNIRRLESSFQASHLRLELLKLKIPKEEQDVITALQASLISRMGVITTNHSTFVSTLNTPTMAGPAPIQELLALEANNPADYFMTITTEQSSALASTARPFLKGTRLNYAGSVVLSFILQDTSGEYVSGNTVRATTCHRTKRSRAFIVPNEASNSDCIGEK